MKHVSVALIALIAMAAGATTQIMPIGDSITVGQVIGQPGVVTYVPAGSYRGLLETKLNEHFADFSFIGDFNTNPGPKAKFVFHNSLSGMGIGPIAGYGNVVYNRMATWFPERGGYHPDIILYLLGINDSNQGLNSSQILSNFTNNIADIMARRPNTLILVSTLIGTSGSTGWIGFNDALRSPMSPIRQWQAQGKKVKLVDINNCHIFPGKMWDYIHPNYEGQSIIATAWFEALREVIPMKNIHQSMPGDSAKFGKE